MSSIQPLIKTVFARLDESLITLGFRKRKGVFTLEVSEDVLGWVGLNRATRGPGVLEINPVVGILNRRVGRLIAELTEEKFDETRHVLASANVGYLSPASKYQPFLFDEATPSDALADSLADSIKLYGLPFIHSKESLSVLVETMRSPRFGNPFNRSYGVPVALHLLGRDSEATAALREEIAKLGSQSDAGSERLRDFSNRFLKRLEMAGRPVMPST